MLGDSINIKSLLQSSSSEKNLVKPLKIAFLGPVCTTKRSTWAIPKMKNNFFFFFRNNKSRSSAFRNFSFYQNIICFGWVMNLFLFCLIFFIKKGSFPAKTAVPSDLENQNFEKKWKKYLEILSFYTHMCTINEDHRYMVPEI